MLNCCMDVIGEMTTWSEVVYLFRCFSVLQSNVFRGIILGIAINLVVLIIIRVFSILKFKISNWNCLLRLSDDPQFLLLFCWQQWTSYKSYHCDLVLHSSTGTTLSQKLVPSCALRFWCDSSTDLQSANSTCLNCSTSNQSKDWLSVSRPAFNSLPCDSTVLSN